MWSLRRRRLFGYLAFISVAWLTVSLFIFNTVDPEGHHLANNPDETLKCQIPRQTRLYPFCPSKCEYLQELGDQDCFRKNGVEKDDLCSIIKYLSEVESWCPVLPQRQPGIPAASDTEKAKAEPRTNIRQLMITMKYPKFKWLRQRITSLWPEWVKALDNLKKKSNNLASRKKLKVLVFLGSFAVSPVLFDWAYTGGPLGELVQWSDLVTSVYMLGHDLIVTALESDLPKLLQVPKGENGCIAPHQKTFSDNFDIIFTDINGVVYIRQATGSLFSRYRCKLRILDSFGTEAEFNYDNYDGKLIPGGKSGWARLDLDLRQFMTMFPHSPDNTFLGFVSGVKVDSKEEQRIKSIKRDQSLVYGKYLDYWQGKEKYLGVINKYFEVHATVTASFSEKNKTDARLPQFVVNHGIVKGTDVRDILQKSKVFVGLGFPYEGPAPLEAIANGAVFINPKFKKPLNRLNSKFFEGKPTLRKVTSQNPYLEDFVGKPFVYTLDMDNMAEVEQTLKEIKQNEVHPFLPFEFTNEGMLQRVSVLMEHQDFCSQVLWPPIEKLTIVLGKKGQSCKTSCWNKGLICEPTFWEIINEMSAIRRYARCSHLKSIQRLDAPSFDPASGDCYTQENVMLYSCVAENPSVRRLCPCRDFQKEQIALCEGCF